MWTREELGGIWTMEDTEWVLGVLTHFLVERLVAGSGVSGRIIQPRMLDLCGHGRPAFARIDLRRKGGARWNPFSNGVSTVGRLKVEAGVLGVVFLGLNLHAE